jgi:hypothetical protein
MIQKNIYRTTSETKRLNMQIRNDSFNRQVKNHCRSRNQIRNKIMMNRKKKRSIALSYVRCLLTCEEKI